MEYLKTHFDEATMQVTFGERDSIIFGEGYGGKIQNGSGYCKEQKFRIFDVLFGKIWLETNEVAYLAKNLDIQTAPFLATISSKELPKTKDELLNVFKKNHNINSSVVAMEDSISSVLPEGIIGKTSPQLFNKFGNRVMFKLKMRDLR